MVGEARVEGERGRRRGAKCYGLLGPWGSLGPQAVVCWGEWAYVMQEMRNGWASEAV